MCQPALITEIRSHGVTDNDIEPHGSHRTLLFAYDGRPVRLVSGTNSSDRHHLRNALADLRRAMGLKRVVVKRRGPKVGGAGALAPSCRTVGVTDPRRAAGRRPLGRR